MLPLMLLLMLLLVLLLLLLMLLAPTIFEKDRAPAWEGCAKRERDSE